MEIESMKLIGTITSGLGEGVFWVKKLHKVFKEKTGIDLFFGTLNVKIDKLYKLEKKLIEVKEQEYGGTERLLIKPCKINGHPAYIVRTESSQLQEGGHPLDILEIMSDVELREMFNLKDGDKVEINV